MYYVCLFGEQVYKILFPILLDPFNGYLCINSDSGIMTVPLVDGNNKNYLEFHRIIAGVFYNFITLLQTTPTPLLPKRSRTDTIVYMHAVSINQDLFLVISTFNNISYHFYAKLTFFFLGRINVLFL